MSRLISSTRFIVLLGVFSSIGLSAALFIVSTYRSVGLIYEALFKIGSEKTAKNLSITAIEQADIFLIATALLIVGIGLSELFIEPIAEPAWLVVKTIDDLKDKLINVVVVVLAVQFLAQVSIWDGKTDLLPLGLAIGAVILSLTGFGLLKMVKKKDSLNGKEEA